jgi:FkbM family methyltransferase
MRRLFKKQDPINKVSYSQQGEDLVIQFILSQKGIEKPYYVDIGANDPRRFSNTYLMYKKGSSGICIDPNPIFKDKYKSIRPKDLFLNSGVSGVNNGTAKFYCMDWHEFSTFDKEQAEKVQENYAGRNNIKEAIDLPIVSVKEVLSKVNANIDFLNLDVEGLDLEILKNWDFINFAPTIICVECKDLKTGKMDHAIHDLVIEKGYSLVASNPINNIYTL